MEGNRNETGDKPCSYFHLYYSLGRTCYFFKKVIARALFFERAVAMPAAALLITVSKISPAICDQSKCAGSEASAIAKVQLVQYDHSNG
jgi:hypothetical protein